MNRKSEDKAEARFLAYVDGLAGVLGHADRMGPLRDYCTGLILPGERKSVEPMAAKTAPARTAAQHQSLLHFVGIATWSDEKVLAKVRAEVIRLRDEIEAIAFEREQQDVGLRCGNSRDQRAEIGFPAAGELLADNMAAELADHRRRRREHLMRPGAVGAKHEIGFAEVAVHVGQELASS